MGFLSFLQNKKPKSFSKDSEEMEFVPGNKYYLATDSKSSEFSVIFEDDGNTGYLYAVLRHGSKPEILDQMLIYTKNDKDILGKKTWISINWSKDNLKALLTLNGLPHAVFDFEHKRGYCLKNSSSSSKKWTSFNHQWDNDILKYFK